jgi:acetyltransferase-like isoleucine patch superfamily enzyme
MNVRRLYRQLRNGMSRRHRRHVSFGDLFTDRWETAVHLGWGEGSSCYDNVLVLGEVRVGRNTWVGPNCILDGSGGLEIGDNCSICAGAQIYTHHTVAWAVSGGEVGPERAPVRIGSRAYIGPNTVVQKGVTIGEGAVIGAQSFVNRDIPAGAKAWGTPARVHGTEEA